MPSSTVSPNPGITGGDRRQEGEREASDVLSLDLWMEILVRLPALQNDIVQSLNGEIRSDFPPRSSDLGPPSFGFGYDPVTDDYKAVSIVHAELECDILTPWPNNGRVTFTEVYSLREASWKDLRGYGIFSDWRLCDWCLKYCVYVNGALHWMAKRAADRDVSRVISFDLSYKELPNFDSGDGRVKLLVLFRGLLAVLCITALDISVWVMRENDWALECTIGSVSTLYNCLFQVRDGISSTVFCEESNELIVAGCHGIGMISYNIKTQEFKSYNPSVTYIGKYVNSLLWRDSLFPLDPPRWS